MKKVSVSDLNSRDIIEAVGGENIVLTVYNAPIALLVPVPRNIDDERLKEAQEKIKALLNGKVD